MKDTNDTGNSEQVQPRGLPWLCLSRPLTRITINKVHFQHFSFLALSLIMSEEGETQGGKGKSGSQGPAVVYHSQPTSAECFSFIFFPDRACYLPLGG